MVCFAPHEVSVMTPLNVAGAVAGAAVRTAASTNIEQNNFTALSFSLSLRLKPKADEYVAACGMVAIKRLDRARKRISSKVCADAGFDRAKPIDITRVANGVGADTENSVDQKLVLIHQLEAPCHEVLPPNRQNRLRQVRIQIAFSKSAVVATPDDTGRPAPSSNERPAVFDRRS